MYFSAVYIDYVDIPGRSSIRGDKQGRCGKTSYFLTLNVNISKTIGDKSIVTIND